MRLEYGEEVGLSVSHGSRGSGHHGGRTEVVKGFLENVFRRALQPLVRLLSRLNVSPNSLSIFGWSLSVAAAALFATGHIFSAGAVMLVGGIFDALDGAVARESHRTSSFGAFLDSTLDRVSEAMIFAGVIFHYSTVSRPELALLAALAMTFSLLTSYTRARAEGIGVECRVGLLERAGRVVILSVTAIFGIFVFGLVLLSVGAAITTVQRILHVCRETVAPVEPPDENTGG